MHKRLKRWVRKIVLEFLFRTEYIDRYLEKRVKLAMVEEVKGLVRDICNDKYIYRGDEPNYEIRNHISRMMKEQVKLQTFQDIAKKTDEYLKKAGYKNPEWEIQLVRRVVEEINRLQLLK